MTQQEPPRRPAEETGRLGDEIYEREIRLGDGQVAHGGVEAAARGAPGGFRWVAPASGVSGVAPSPRSEATDQRVIAGPVNTALDAVIPLELQGPGGQSAAGTE